jgi:hypothetical protein
MGSLPDIFFAPSLPTQPSVCYNHGMSCSTLTSELTVAASFAAYAYWYFTNDRRGFRKAS